MRTFSRVPFVAATALLLAAVAADAQKLPTAQANARQAAPEQALVARLKWRSVGPANMGGRTTAIEGVPGDPKAFYVGGADGGVWKTTNGGTTWKPLFEDQAVYSIGAITLAPSDPNVVWVGTGEGDPRNSASFGDGVYRSTDGGEHWTHLGLEDSERIKRIAVDPRDPDVAYVCALGHAWGPNAERGVFRTGDAGKSWQKVLFLDEDTGCSDIAMRPDNPRVLYAGMYTFRRKPWRLDSGAGRTALYRSRDAGATWEKLTGKGMPTEPMDRIGVAVARGNPDVVYMITETKTQGELFRSDDGGDTWRKVSDDRNINFRPFYYADIRVDPQNADRVYALSGSLQMSEDGGKTFRNIGRGIHGDHQSFWIDPTDPKRLLSGSDGGFQASDDQAKTWNILNNVVLSQFYHVDFDMERPYTICGGLQDNGTWCGPSRTAHNDGPMKDDWFTVGGGDGFYAVPVVDKPWLVYNNLQGGAISLNDTRSGSNRNIQPYPKFYGSFGGALADVKYRFNWDAPILVSPHDPKVVYFGGNVLFRSADYGQSWQEISPDLTTNDKSQQQSSGGDIVVDNTAAEFHNTILTIAESPVTAGVIWVGTDDGLVQLTRDGGKTWTDVTDNIPRYLPNSWVSRVDASHRDAGTAYVAVDRHQMNDFAPHAYVTTDFGKTWRDIAAGLPPKGYVHVVREDPKNPELLYAGTELGVFASWDRGRRWVSIRNGLPPVAVRDIKVHPRDNDIILATHGRGAWILDDATPLQQLASVAAPGAPPKLFDVRPAVRWQPWDRAAALGSATWVGQNPPAGALITYSLKADKPQPVTLTVKDAAGTVVRVLHDTASGKGLERIAWDLRYDGPKPVPGAPTRPGGEESFFRRMGLGPTAAPGDYTVTLAAAGAELKTPVKIEPDPRVQLSAADYAVQLKTGLEIRDLVGRVNELVGRTESLQRQLAALDRQLGGAPADGAAAGAPGAAAAAEKAAPPAGADAAILADVRVATDRLKELRDKLTRPTPTFGYRQVPRARELLQSLGFAIDGASAPPTDGQLTVLAELEGEVARLGSELDGIVGGPVAAVNQKMAGRPRVSAEVR